MAVYRWFLPNAGQRSLASNEQKILGQLSIFFPFHFFYLMQERKEVKKSIWPSIYNFIIVIVKKTNFNSIQKLVQCNSNTEREIKAFQKRTKFPFDLLNKIFYNLYLGLHIIANKCNFFPLNSNGLFSLYIGVVEFLTEASDA